MHVYMQILKTTVIHLNTFFSGGQEPDTAVLVKCGCRILC